MNFLDSGHPLQHVLSTKTTQLLLHVARMCSKKQTCWWNALATATGSVATERSRLTSDKTRCSSFATRLSMCAPSSHQKLLGQWLSEVDEPVGDKPKNHNSIYSNNFKQIYKLLGKMMFLCKGHFPQFTGYVFSTCSGSKPYIWYIWGHWGPSKIVCEETKTPSSREVENV